MEIKLADFSHKQELLELWREAFGDSEDFILSFLNGYLLPEYNTPVVIADGKIVSALYLIEFELHSEMKVIGTCAYLFAAATLEAYRGRGYMSRLMRYATELYKRRGIAAIFLFPQEGSEKLFDFYAKFGYKAVYQAKKICAAPGKSDLTGFRLVNHEINNTEVFDGLYKSYAEFTAKQNLSPLKDRLFYFKCASSYLDTADKYFAVLERERNNNVEKFCYVFYKKFENNYYIDDIIMSEYNNMHGNAQRSLEETAAVLADFILRSMNSGDNIDNINNTKVEMNVPPEKFNDEDNIKTAMILPLNTMVKSIAENLKSPVYLNMYMNI
jgi:predicted acetyltransferase